MSSEKIIRDSIAIARKNWRDWQDVYEHVGRISTNPICAALGRFGSFCKEYSVHRRIG
jgi:hypothetical protein